MNSRRLKKSAGFTFVDALVFLSIVVMLVILFFKSFDVYDAIFRKNCWSNQKYLQEVLEQTLYENQLEISQVFVAYTLFDPTHSPQYRLIIVLDPVYKDFLAYLDGKTAEEAAKENDIKLPPFIEVDLEQAGASTQSLCPLRQGETPKYAIIDYWYVPYNRFFCMHNELHN